MSPDSTRKTVVAAGKHIRMLRSGQWEYVERAGITGIVGDATGVEREDLITAARRELLEETGYEAAGMSLLAEGPPSAGITSEIVTFFRAMDLEKTGEGGGVEDERITVHEVPLTEADEWLRRMTAQGRLVDPKVYAGLYFALH